MPNNHEKLRELVISLLCDIFFLPKNIGVNEKFIDENILQYFKYNSYYVLDLADRLSVRLDSKYDLPILIENCKSTQALVEYCENFLEKSGR